MQVNAIGINHQTNFKGLPPRQYPYELPYDYPVTQAETQMPKVREQIREFARKDDIVTSMQNLQDSINNAAQYLNPKSQKAQKTLLKYSNAAKLDNIVTNSELKYLISLSAQSGYQQDKHDAVWLFNKYNERPNADKSSVVIPMAQAFHHIDRTYDTAEIDKAEASLREIYQNSSSFIKADLADLYGKNFNFNA